MFPIFGAMFFGQSLGCSETPTSLRVHLVYEKSWSLDHVELSIADLSDEISIASELTILLPEDVTGKLHTLTVHAFHGEERFAYGQADVVPLRGEEVDVTVTLTRLPCGAWCQPGQTQCRADGIVLCEQRDDDHCFEWSDRLPCSTETPYCSLGQCSSECIHECAEGERRCAGPSALQVCGQGDSDPCLEWLDIVTCPAGDSCSSGNCRSECVDECTLGEIECSGASLQECADLNLDGCTEWGPPITCPDGQTCNENKCEAIDECTDECSENECSELVFHECGQFDRDSCLDRSPGTSCVSTDACIEGSCSFEGCTQLPKTCNTPDGTTCIDSMTLRVFDAEGSCSEGECSYTSRDIDCPNCAVIDGQPNCDPCRMISCDRPPEPTQCYQPVGTCSEGACSYEHENGAGCNDNDPCTENDLCREGTCAGAVIRCDLIPESICADASTLRVYSAGGICARGECIFPHTDTLCPSGCNETGGAHCIDPCEGVSCNRPPSPHECYQSVGTCNEGSCSYGYANGSSCDDDDDCTTNDSCNRGHCAGTSMICDDVPEPTCADSRTLRTFRAGGACRDGQCQFPFDDTLCEGRCENVGGAQCVGTCPEVCEPELITRTENEIWGTTLDESYLYWTHHDEVQRRLLSGGTIETFAINQNLAYDIVLSETNVYWTDFIGDRIQRKSKDGGRVETLATRQDRASAIALDDRHIYWIYNDFEIRRRLLSSDTVETVAENNGYLRNIALDETHIYWVTYTGGLVRRMPKDGGNIETIASGQSGALGLTLDDTHIYWINFRADEVRRAPKTGGTAVIIASHQDGPYGLALDDTHVYWTNAIADQIRRAPKNGGEIETIASAQDGANNLVLNDTHIYWVNADVNELMRISRCACGL